MPYGARPSLAALILSLTLGVTGASAEPASGWTDPPARKPVPAASRPRRRSRVARIAPCRLDPGRRGPRPARRSPRGLPAKRVVTHHPAPAAKGVAATRTGRASPQPPRGSFARQDGRGRAAAPPHRRRTAIRATGLQLRPGLCRRAAGAPARRGGRGLPGRAPPHRGIPGRPVAAGLPTGRRGASRSEPERPPPKSKTGRRAVGEHRPQRRPQDLARRVARQEPVPDDHAHRHLEAASRCAAKARISSGSVWGALGQGHDRARAPRRVSGGVSAAPPRRSRRGARRGAFSTSQQ